MFRRVSMEQLNAPRGLELIRSCAKFYGNGVGLAQSTVQLSHPTLNQPATRQRWPSRSSGITTIAVVCFFFLVLPGLALATIVYWRATTGDAERPKLAGD